MNTITHFLFLKHIIENDIKYMYKPTKNKPKYKGYIFGIICSYLNFIVSYCTITYETTTP